MAEPGVLPHSAQEISVPLRWERLAKDSFCRLKPAPHSGHLRNTPSAGTSVTWGAIVALHLGQKQFMENHPEF
jgi:hypothetical protein